MESFGNWPDRALADLDRAARLSPFDALLTIRYPIGGWALLRLGRVEEAIEWSERGTQEVRSLFWPALHVAAGSMVLGDPDRAARFIAEALRRAPDLDVESLRANTAYLADQAFVSWYIDCLAEAGLPHKASFG